MDMLCKSEGGGEGSGDASKKNIKDFNSKSVGPIM